MHYTELQHIGFYLTNYADRLIGIELTLSQQVQEKTEKNSRINHNIEQNIILQILKSA